MAKEISDEELQLKKSARRRLVGAIALVLIVVVFLPMFLDNEPRPLSQDIAINIPPIPPADQSPTLTSPQAQIATESSKLSSGGEPAVSGIPAQQSEAAPTPKPEAAKSAAPTTAATNEPLEDEGYVVQLGAFSNPAKARQLVAKLKENRFRAYTQTVKTAGGALTRVRVGAYPTREAAEKAREQLKTRRLVIGDATVVPSGS
jgi:DedD protein